jgi:hypothetical protein
VPMSVSSRIFMGMLRGCKLFNCLIAELLYESSLSGMGAWLHGCMIA